jgi:hypothetical protein
VGWDGPADPEILPWSVIKGTGNGSGTMVAQVNYNSAHGEGFDPVTVPDNATVSTWYTLVEQLPGVGVSVRYNYRYTDNNGTVQTKQLSQSGSPTNIIWYSSDYTRSARVENWQRIGGPAPIPVAEVAWEDLEPIIEATQTAPIEPDPVVAKSDLPPPIRTPTVAPPPDIEALPNTSSAVVPTTPGPVAPAVVRPALPATVAPIPVPTATPTKDGAVVPRQPAPFSVTPNDAIYPVPGGSPVSGQTVRRTVQGIAQEVGRIEQKIDKMINPTPNQWGNGLDVMDLIREGVESLVNAVVALTSGTSYTLDSPCEVDEVTGEKLPPVVVEAPGAFGSFGTILNRIDAIAELIQVHKDLKQPNCKPKQPVGEFVTVNFEEID